MVPSSSYSPRSDPPVVADAASGDLDPAAAIMHWHLGARSRSRHHLAAVPPPRALLQNRADSLMAATPLAAAAAASSSSSSSSSSSQRNNATSTSSASAGGRTTLSAVSTPVSATSIQPPGTRPHSTTVSAPSTQSPGTGAVRAPVPRTVPVAAITCAAVGGAVVLAAVLALIYMMRVRRRVKRMKRCTNILGPGALPLWQGQGRALFPSLSMRQFLSCLAQTPFVCFLGLELAPVLSPRLSHLTIDSRVKPDLASPTTASPTKYLLAPPPPLSAAAISRNSRSSVEQQHVINNGPLSPTRRSVVVLSLPPAPRRTSALSPTPRSPIRPSRAFYAPPHDHERGTTPDYDSSHS
ncbi:hypothetical protein BC826DRAFT_1004623 [Russula brevipes]|nr:hypothetical protein BC826DRAFT_1004623 [Russula brevipes]